MNEVALVALRMLALSAVEVALVKRWNRAGEKRKRRNPCFVGA